MNDRRSSYSSQAGGGNESATRPEVACLMFAVGVARIQAQECPNWPRIAKKSIPVMEPFAAVRSQTSPNCGAGPRSKAVW
jgi:hypothetical protein